MKHTIYIFIIFGFFAISSCQKKLDIDLPETEKKIVVNGLLSTDSLIKVNVSKSIGILDNTKIEFLTNANVKLYKNDTFIENLVSSGNGNFVSSFTPEINSNYKITVDYNNLKSVNTNTTLKNPVPILSIDTLSEIQIYNYDGYSDTTTIYHFKLKLSDNVNENNFYFLNFSGLQPIYEFIDDQYVITGYEESNFYFNSEDPVFNNENSYFTLNKMDGRCFNDELFNGKEYTIDFEFPYNKYMFGTFGEPAQLSTFYINLLTIPDALYYYINSYNLNQYTQYDPFAQPVRIYSNVENGLGIVTGYTLSKDSVLINNQ
jgi:hypothetical protein